MKIYVKYMVTLRCKMMVKEELTKIGLQCVAVKMGSIEIIGGITPKQHKQLNIALLKLGLELMDEQTGLLIENTKNIIIEMIDGADEVPEEDYSNYISPKLNCDYLYIAKMFAEVTGITIQHFITIHKIERAKEFILYDNLSLSQIAHKLNYSNVERLSTEFKKITGLSPNFFVQLKQKRDAHLLNV